MLGDYKIDEFEDRWAAMVEKFGVDEVDWVEKIYEKRGIWATTHMQGNFFAGLRMTTRYEALHSQIMKYIKSEYNLTKFVEHCNRCSDSLCNNEVEADLGLCEVFP